MARVFGLLKLDLAHHARAADWSAEYEVAAPDGSWRADVMATSPDGSRRIALEAQMAAISITDIEARTHRYRDADVEVCWFTDRKTAPWLDHVPSVQIARSEDEGDVQVTAGATRFESRWCEDRGACSGCDCEDCGEGLDGPLPCEGHGGWRAVDPFPPRPTPGWSQEAAARFWPRAEEEFWRRVRERDFEGAARGFRRIAEQVYEQVTYGAASTARGARAREEARVELYGGRPKTVKKKAAAGGGGGEAR